MVARGFTQEEGVDFTETYAPVMKFETFRILIALALNLGLNISSYDVVAAYLYSEIDQEVYMTQPENYQVGDSVLRLKKGLYGLRQSAKLWNDDLKKKLLEFGCIQSINDPGLYIYVMNNSFCWILVYVDDIIVFSNSATLRGNLEQHLKRYYDITHSEKLTSLLGIRVEIRSDNVLLYQRHYIEQISQKFGQTNSKRATTPIDTGIMLTPSGKSEQSYPYRSIIGSLMFPARMFRPDISYAVGYLARFSDKYSSVHWNQAKKVVRYLESTKNCSMVYRKSSLKITCYVDASFGGDGIDCRSTTGYLIYLGDNLVIWKSSKQKTTALSTAEAEIVAARECLKDAIWLRESMKELGMGEQSITIKEDNQACIKLCEKQMINTKVKHIAIAISFIREQVENGIVNFEYCSTNDMIADCLTKALGPNKVKEFRGLMNIHDGGVLDDHE